MLFVYAAQARIRPRHSSGASPEEGFKLAVAEWASNRLGFEVVEWAGGQADRGGSRAEWTTLDGRRGRLLRLAAVNPDIAGTWIWHIVVWFGLSEGESWIRVRIGLEPRLEGTVIDPSVSVGAPRFLRSLAEEFDVSIDGRDLGSWWLVDETQVPSYVAFLESAERRIPVVAITRTSGGATQLAPERLVNRLAGLAHVVAVEPAATYGVSDAITPTRSVFGGAIRLYWPGFSRESRPYSHPLYMPRGQYLGSDAFVDDLAARLGRSAGLSFGPPVLEAELRREVATKAAEEARSKQAERQVRQAEVIAKADGGLSAEEFEVFSKDFEEEAARRAQLEDRVAELEADLEEEREFRVSQETAHREAWQLLGTSGALGAPAVSTSTSTERGEPRSVREAVELADECCPALIFTQSAYESAEESQFSSPADVLADLLLLQDVASQWAAGTMKGDFRNAFDGRHSNYRSGISQTAATQYGGDYTISYDGRTVQMGPHLCRGGVGAPPTILRIYWFKDDANKKLVVGHVGKKLRDDSNPG